MYGTGEKEESAPGARDVGRTGEQVRRSVWPASNRVVVPRHHPRLERGRSAQRRQAATGRRVR
eukprot:5296822-Pleurochrysis_carterae.AAC.1